MSKDWTGNSRSSHVILGSRTYATQEREQHDFYATDPRALELLLDIETFDTNIWECACGEGHLGKVLENRGYNVKATDLIQRGYGIGGVDFLQQTEPFNGDIITNPPYKFAQEFVEHSLELIPTGKRVAMFLKIQFLESKSRRKLFEKHPPKIVYVASSRFKCGLNGDFDKFGTGAVAYCWYIWEKGYTGDPIIKWFN